MNTEITFAIPFYRGLDYLREAVESVLAQEREGWRLLVCDDSGNAESGAGDLVSAYADPRIRYHRSTQNLGMVANWNLCLDLAESDLVTLLHADDALLPGYAGLMGDLADRHSGAAACFCAARIVDDEGRERPSMADTVKGFFSPSGPDEMCLEGEPALRALMAGNFIMCPTLCYRKSRLGARRFWQGWKQVQDLELTSRLLMDGEQLVGTREVAYTYRRHAESATQIQSESMLRFDEEFELFDRVAERAEALGWKPAARVSRRKRILRLHLLYRALRELGRGRVGASASHLRYLISRT
ncbi:MAG: glycosyltransferase family 2 protein [Deltaproteobacteria bacterium]|nr:glycosyltransferase family 2 protein [Deltaproteobacteria bacterium]MBW2419515.1 glycosyltransferase family 2 protein [Deltaproteobacteria bacterium]